MGSTSLSPRRSEVLSIKNGLKGFEQSTTLPPVLLGLLLYLAWSVSCLSYESAMFSISNISALLTMDNFRMKAVFLSRWLENPYKRILASSLKEIDIDVEEHLWQIFFLPKVLANGRPTVVHFHTLHPFFLARNIFSRLTKFFIFVSQLSLLRILGIRSVWTVHEWANKITPGQSLFSRAEAMVLGKMFHNIISHCQSTSEEVSRFFGLERSDKVKVIPHGNYICHYDNSVTQSRAREVLKLPQENTVFLIFGGVYPYKGILDGIDAFQRLKSRSVSLVIAGKMHLTTVRQKELYQAICARIHNSSSINFVPESIPEADIQYYMNACDCVVTPYKVFTTSGITILAMSFKRACIAPRKGFFKDVLDSKGAILYRHDDSNALYHAMEKVTDQREMLRQMGEHNMTLVQQWGWDHVAKETSSAYQKRV